MSAPYRYYPQQPYYPREGIAITTGYSPLSWSLVALVSSL